MIEHIPELAQAGISSFKIEGRAKSAYYTAVVTNAYRLAVDAYFEQPNSYRFNPLLLEEIKKVSHRDYCTGFYFGPVQNGQIYKGGYDRGYDVIAAVEKQSGQFTVCRQLNLFKPGDEAEALEPGKLGAPVKIEAIFDENQKPLTEASFPNMKLLILTDRQLSARNNVTQKAKLKNSFIKFKFLEVKMSAITFVMLKPDAVERNLVYTVMSYFEKAGIIVKCFDLQKVKPELIKQHYAEHIIKFGPEFERKTLEMFEGKYVIPIILEGSDDVIAKVREIVGATEPLKAAKGTIRGDLGLDDSYTKSTLETGLCAI